MRFADTPLIVDGGLFVQRFRNWFEQLVWPVTFAELAVSFVLYTASSLPVFSKALGWRLPPLTDECIVQVASASRVMAATFRWLISAGFFPVQLQCRRVRSLGALGYKVNQAFAAGLSVRPQLDCRVTECLKLLFHQGHRRRCLSQVLHVAVGETDLPISLLG